MQFWPGASGKYTVLKYFWCNKQEVSTHLGMRGWGAGLGKGASQETLGLLEDERWGEAAQGRASHWHGGEGAWGAGRSEPEGQSGFPGAARAPELWREEACKRRERDAAAASSAEHWAAAQESGVDGELAAEACLEPSPGDEPSFLLLSPSSSA